MKAGSADSCPVPFCRAESAKSRCGGGFSCTSTSAAVAPRNLPERRYHGTPAQRHESMKSRRAQKVSTSRVLRHVRLLPVAGILAAHHVVGLQRTHGEKDIGLLAVHRAKASVGRRLHGQQRDDLEKMVLDHVAQTAGGFVKRAAALHAEILGQSDLHARDVVAIPDRLQERIGKAEIEDVHDRFLAEEVVDAENRVFREHRLCDAH